MKRFNKIMDYVTIISIIVIFECGCIDSIIDRSDSWFWVIAFAMCGISGPFYIWRLFKRNNYTLD